MYESVQRFNLARGRAELLPVGAALGVGAGEAGAAVLPGPALQ